jgi:hypothetical protein
MVLEVQAILFNFIIGESISTILFISSEWQAMGKASLMIDRMGNLEGMTYLVRVVSPAILLAIS